MRRWSGAVVAAVVLSMLWTSVASATVMRRSWSASFGPNGRGTLQGYDDGTGRLFVAATGLRARATYSLQIRKGGCSTTGTVAASVPAATADSTGRLSAERWISQAKMKPVWDAMRITTISLRLVHSSRTYCANLKFPFATRVQISALGINLPVIAGSNSYPKCNVAMYMKLLWQPREPGVTFLYAHARKGMFLPLLTRSKTNNGASMIGMTVKVWTSDSKVHTYRIDRVRRHVTSLGTAFGITAQRLWLQTSEGPSARYPKLIVEAKRLSTASATYAASHPTARPVSC